MGHWAGPPQVISHAGKSWEEMKLEAIRWRPPHHSGLGEARRHVEVRRGAGNASRAAKPVKLSGRIRRASRQADFEPPLVLWGGPA